MHCPAYTKDQLPVIIGGLQDVNLLVASEKGFKLHLKIYPPIGFFSMSVNQNIENIIVCEFSESMRHCDIPLIPMAQFERTFRWIGKLPS